MTAEPGRTEAARMGWASIAPEPTMMSCSLAVAVCKVCLAHLAHGRDTILDEEDHRRTGLEDIRVRGHLRDVHVDRSRIVMLR